MEQLLNGLNYVLLIPNLKIRPIDTEVAEKAAELRAKYDIRPPDALQVGASLGENADAFVTNDRKLKRIREIKIVVMEEELKRKGKPT